MEFHYGKRYVWPFGKIQILPTPFGNRSSVFTLKTFASRKSSLSLTHRMRASICDRVPRLISNPLSWHLAANCSWVKRRFFRNFLICGPTTFAGLFVRAMLSFEPDRIRKHVLYCYAFLAAMNFDLSTKLTPLKSFRIVKDFAL